MTCAWSEELTYDYLERLLAGAREGFELRPLRDGPGTAGDPPRAIVRHDIDVSLHRAVALAEREASWGIVSTYLVQLDSPLYNLYDAKEYAALRRLIDMGFEVGLHVDVGSANSADGSSVPGLEQRVCAARERLEALTGLPVESVSFHRPASVLLHSSDRICGMVNAYGKEMMATYLSDSGGNWRNGEPLRLIRAAKGRLLQILVHPIWWGERHLSPRDRLQGFFEANVQGMAQDEAETFDVELVRAIGPPMRSGLG